MEVFVVGQLPDEASFFFAHCSLALPETVLRKREGRKEGRKGGGGKGGYEI